MEEAVRAAVRFAAERAAETEREDVREIERLLAAFAPGGVAVIGAASRDSVRHFAAWADIGDKTSCSRTSNTCGILSQPMGRRRKPRPKFRLSKSTRRCYNGKYGGSRPAASAAFGAAGRQGAASGKPAAGRKESNDERKGNFGDPPALQAG